MLNQIKKGLAFMLLLLIFCQGGGLQLLLSIKQKLAQHEMTELLSGNRAFTKLITLNISTYRHALRNSHEIELQGKLYDIKKVSLTNNTAQLEVVEDHKEGHVLAVIKKLIGEETPGKQTFPHKLLQFMSLMYMPSNLAFSFLYNDNQAPIFYDIDLNTSLGFHNVPYSPPDFI